MFGGASAARTLTCKRIRQEEPVESVRKKMKATNGSKSYFVFVLLIVTA
jgi:hypothetical protein